MPDSTHDAFAQLRRQAQLTAGRVEDGIRLAVQVGRQIDTPGGGSTLLRWRTLAALGAGDLTAARVVEPHVDALAILQEAGETAAPGSWGVFASEQPDSGLTACLTEQGWVLTGVKPWCSLGATLDHALITATVGQDGRRLFAIDLRNSSVRHAPATGWVSRGLSAITSVSLHLDQTPAQPVGELDWYLRRPGFAWGGVGVAACWYGAAAALGNTLRQNALANRRRGAGFLDPLLALALGQTDLALHRSWLALESSAEAIDSGRADGAAGQKLALRVRSIVAAAAEEISTVIGHALGPRPLAFDEEHARRVADLGIYVRQHHGERDIAELGSRLFGEGTDSDDIL